MESDGFNGLAVFIVLAVITGVMCYLAVMQSRVKKQIEESRRERESAELTALGTTIIPTTPITPPDVAPGLITDITPSSLPKITPGGTPPPDTGSQHHTSPPPTDSGGPWSGGSGFETGGGSSGGDGGGHSGGHH
jgi:uncharacterized membrane protein YgcG